MDYSNLFSHDVDSFFRSPVRDIFKKVDLNSIYSFAGGYPSAETFPLEAIKQTMSEVIDKYGGKAFQYGATQGVRNSERPLLSDAECLWRECRSLRLPSRESMCVQGYSLIPEMLY